MGLLRNIGTLFDYIANPEEYKDAGNVGEQFLYRHLKDYFIRFGFTFSKIMYHYMQRKRTRLAPNPSFVY